MLVAIAVFVALIIVLLLIQYALLYSAWRHEVIERKHQRMKDRMALYDHQMERVYRRHIRCLFAIMRITVGMNEVQQSFRKADRHMVMLRHRIGRFNEMYETVDGPETAE